MKKILIFSFAFIFFIIGLSVEARTKVVKVFALDTFSTEYPKPFYQVQLIEDDLIGSRIFRKGTIISGQVLRVEAPKRGKRNAYFEFIPTTYSYNGIVNDFGLICVAQVVGYKELDPQKAAIYLAKKATNFVFKGASIGIAFIEGVAKADEGARLKSGFVSAYKDSPLSYIEVGKNLEVKPGDMIILKFKEL